MLEPLLVLAAPFAVKELTSWIKTMGQIPSSDYRVEVIRSIVAMLALVAAVLAQWIGEGAVEVGIIETAVYTLTSAGIATWLYLKEKKA
jgi:hypothetical protein